MSPVWQMHYTALKCVLGDCIGTEFDRITDVRTHWGQIVILPSISSGVQGHRKQSSSQTSLYSIHVNEVKIEQSKRRLTHLQFFFSLFFITLANNNSSIRKINCLNCPLFHQILLLFTDQSHTNCIQTCSSESLLIICRPSPPGPLL